MSVITEKESQLLELLKQDIQKVLKLIAGREGIRKKSEGRLSISYPGPMEQEQKVTVTLDSYLMSDFDLKTSWTKPTLEKALLRAICDVRLWYKLEKESIPSNFMVDRIGITI